MRFCARWRPASVMRCAPPTPLLVSVVTSSRRSSSTRLGRATEPARQPRPSCEQALARPVLVSGQETMVSAKCLGVAIGTVRSTASSLLRDADVAIYRAKASGSGHCVTYQPEMREASAERRRLESELAHALAGDQFRLVYQPVIHLMTGRVTGFEALLRWHHPTLGLITPDRFIPIIEETARSCRSDVGCCGRPASRPPGGKRPTTSILRSRWP